MIFQGDSLGLPAPDQIRIAVVGLGYVGLPLAVYLSRHFPVVGFDVDRTRIEEIRKGVDRTGELTPDELQYSQRVAYNEDSKALSDCNFYIVTVPTPIDQAKRPDLSAMIAASRTVAGTLSTGNVVVYESTVYPGVTEEVCAPILAQISGLKLNQDFFVGYSPERINPGDHAHRLPDIIKVTSGSTPEAADLINAVYGKVVKAGTHKTSSIRVAEAAKVIENIQRDVNIALVNELAMLFKQLGLETAEVLQAAGTKWNFQAFRPGLVGGHCIGVDPYYLTHLAESVGFHPQMILAGRRINDGMASYVVGDLIKAMLKRKQRVDTARVLVMGFTFKENCPDTRNTKVADLVRELSGFVAEVAVYDPVADADHARHEYGITLSTRIPDGQFDAVVLAVKHQAIAGMGEAAIRKLLTPNGMIYDIKEILPLSASNARL
jgi:UDP-N-acetyl-D-galactosamine dehydrogenase